MSRPSLFLLACAACGGPSGSPPPEAPRLAARVLDPGCPGSAYATVQAAIDDADQNDVVEVCAGTWQERLVISGKRLTLRSADGAADTVLDGGGLGTTLTIDGNAIVTVEGLTLTGGSTATGWGGNVHCEQANLLLRDNVIEGGDAFKGGGVSMRSCTGRVEGNTFRDNHAIYRGAGLYAEGSVDILGNTFEANEADDAGGGAYFKNSYATIRDNTVIGNVAGDDGGGFFVARGAPWVDSNLFDGNESDEEGGGLRIKSSEAMITDNVISNNVASWRGGGSKISHDESVISGNTWIGNEAGSKGGAALLFESASWLTFEHYEANEASDGAALAIIEGWGGVIIEDSTFVANDASDEGGHLYVDLLLETVALRRVDLVGGEADVGGAIFAMTGSDLDLRNVLFASNAASEGGGALWLDGTTGLVHNSVLLWNDSPDGAAIRVEHGAPFEVKNSVFEGNTGGATISNVAEPGVYPFYIPIPSLPPTFRYNDFYGNVANFSGLWSPIGANGNIVVQTGFVDPVAGDCTLTPSSALRNAGDPFVLDPDGSRSDIGMHGGPYAL